MTSAAEIAAKCSPRRNLAGGSFMICCPAAGHDDRTPSCKLWDGPDGRALFHCFAGCDWRAVRAGAASVGLIEDARCKPLSEAERAKAEQARAESQRRFEQERRRKWRWAKQLWEGSRQIYGTPAASYLEARAIKPPFPASLRFASRIQHPRVEGHAGPAMVARVTLPTGKGVAVHLTFLDGDRKAAIDPAKIIIGPAKGGAVHLCGAPPGDALAVSEGIETGLAIRQSTGLPTWAALSSSLMEAMKLPAGIAQLYIGADGDAAGAKASRALASLARFSGCEGIKIVPAPDGFDWNDILRGKAA